MSLNANALKSAVHQNQTDAFDLNPYHLALTRLKIAAFKHLPDHQHFYEFFGYADKKANLEHYKNYVHSQIIAMTVLFFWMRKIG